MSEAIEVKVKVSNDEQNYAKKFLCYEPLTLSKDDPVLLGMVEGTVAEFKGGADDMDVIFKMKW